MKWGNKLDYYLIAKLCRLFQFMIYVIKTYKKIYITNEMSFVFSKTKNLSHFLSHSNINILNPKPIIDLFFFWIFRSSRNRCTWIKSNYSRKSKYHRAQSGKLKHQPKKKINSHKKISKIKINAGTFKETQSMVHFSLVYTSLSVMRLIDVKMKWNVNMKKYSQIID